MTRRRRSGLKLTPRQSIALTAALLCAPAGAGAQNLIPSTPTTRPGSNPSPRTLSLGEAVGVGLKNSKELQLAAEAVYRARGRVNEQKAGFLPSAGSTATFTHLNSGTSATVGGQSIPIVKQNQKQVGINVLAPIDITGLIKSAEQQAEFQEIAARLDYNRTRNETVVGVKSAYYDVLRAKAFVDVEEQALKNSQDRQTVAEANLRAGTGTKFEVLRAQTDVANAQQNLISARNRVNLTTATLNNVLGLDQNTPLTVTEAHEENTSPGVFDRDVEEAYRQRPEVLESEANIRAAEKGVRIAARSALPTISAGLNFNYTPDASGFAPKETSWAAVATLNLPLFDQGLSRARRQQARADVNTAKLNKATTLDTVALDVRQTHLALQEALDRLNVTAAALVEAQEQYRLAQVRFKAGVTAVPGGSPLLEISDAQAALTQAQTNQVNAQYDVQSAKARLDHAAGRYAFNGVAQPGLPSPKMP